MYKILGFLLSLCLDLVLLVAKSEIRPVKIPKCMYFLSRAIKFGLLDVSVNTLNTNEVSFYRENKNLTGTARYASVNTHLGVGECHFL